MAGQLYRVFRAQLDNAAKVMVPLPEWLFLQIEAAPLEAMGS